MLFREHLQHRRRPNFWKFWAIVIEEIRPFVQRGANRLAAAQLIAMSCIIGAGISGSQTPRMGESLAMSERNSKKIIKESICYNVLALGKLFAGWYRTEHTGPFKIVLSQSPLKSIAVQLCPRNQSGADGRVDLNHR